MGDPTCKASRYPPCDRGVFTTYPRRNRAVALAVWSMLLSHVVLHQ